MRLLANIHSETPLGSLIKIRSENNEDTLKCFSKEQLKIRDKWRMEHRREETLKEQENRYNRILQSFKSM